MPGNMLNRFPLAGCGSCCSWTSWPWHPAATRELRQHDRCQSCPVRNSRLCHLAGEGPLMVMLNEVAPCTCALDCATEHGTVLNLVSITAGCLPEHQLRVPRRSSFFLEERPGVYRWPACSLPKTTSSSAAYEHMRVCALCSAGHVHIFW